MIINPYIFNSTPIPPVTGDSFVFDGVNESIDFGDSTVLDGRSAFSIGVWFKTDNLFTASAERLITKDATGSNRTFYLSGFTGSKVRFLISTNGTSNDSLNGVTAVSINTWYRALVTWDGSTINIYLNGSLDATRSTSNATGTITNTTSKLMMGSYDGAVAGQLLAGKLANGIIYDKALSAGEALADFNQDYSSIGTNIVSRWKAEDAIDGAGGVVDSVGSVDGTFQNMTVADNVSTDYPT